MALPAKSAAFPGEHARVRAHVRIVVVDDFEKLEDRLSGTLKIMREIAKITGKKG